jgi:hypothetical protein
MIARWQDRLLWICDAPAIVLLRLVCLLRGHREITIVPGWPPLCWFCFATVEDA